MEPYPLKMLWSSMGNKRERSLSKRGQSKSSRRSVHADSDQTFQKLPDVWSTQITIRAIRTTLATRVMESWMKGIARQAISSIGEEGMQLVDRELLQTGEKAHLISLQTFTRMPCEERRDKIRSITTASAQSSLSSQIPQSPSTTIKDYWQVIQTINNISNSWRHWHKVIIQSRIEGIKETHIWEWDLIITEPPQKGALMRRNAFIEVSKRVPHFRMTYLTLIAAFNGSNLE